MAFDYKLTAFIAIIIGVLKLAVWNERLTMSSMGDGTGYWHVDAVSRRTKWGSSSQNAQPVLPLSFYILNTLYTNMYYRKYPEWEARESTYTSLMAESSLIIDILPVGPLLLTYVYVRNLAQWFAAVLGVLNKTDWCHSLIHVDMEQR